jgi:hypothetical protein
MIRSTDIEDTYKGGAFLRVWSVSSSGQAICAQDAHATAATEQATLDATTASNAKIRVALAAVDGLEAAKRVAEPDGDIPKTVTETDIDGNETVRPYRAWAEYDAAQATIDGATEATNQFALVRSLGVQSETLPKTETTTEPIFSEPVTTTEMVLDEEGNPVLDEEGNTTTQEVVTEGVDTGEVREIVTVVKGETVPNPDYAAWKAAWDAVDADLNG